MNRQKKCSKTLEERQEKKREYNRRYMKNQMSTPEGRERHKIAQERYQRSKVEQIKEKRKIVRKKYYEKKKLNRQRGNTPFDMQAYMPPSTPSVDDPELPNGLPLLPPISDIHTASASKTHVCNNKQWRMALQQANRQQLELIQHIRYHLLQGEGPCRILIQGMAGTGKSRVISLLYQMMTDLFGEGYVRKMAHTGKAAHQIGGLTLHSTLRIPITSDTPLSPRELQNFQKRYAKLQCIIVDEISLVGDTLFNKVNSRLKDLKQCQEPFGGLHVLLFGDFLQLAPVFDTSLSLSDSPLNLFEFYELTENMRQKEDPEYFKMLCDMRFNIFTEEQIQRLNTRVVPVDQVPSDAIWLHQSNARVQQAHQRILKDNSVLDCLAFDTVKDTVNQLKWKRTKETFREDINKLVYKLPLVLNLRYVITHNVDIEKGMVNGATGFLRQINRSGKGIQNIVLEMPHGTITLHRVQAKLEREGGLVKRRQFPCKLAESMTVHAAQGSTLQTICVESFYSLILWYVALSRVSKLTDLYLVKKILHLPWGNDHILKWLSSKRATALTPHYKFLSSETDHIQIMYHNVQGLEEHYADLQSDPCFLHSDILLLSETWTILGDRFQWKGFYELCHIPSDTSTRQPSGVSIYIKKKLWETQPEYRVYPNYWKGIHLCTVRIQSTRIAVMHAHPHVTVQDILEQVGQCVDPQMVLMGHFDRISDTTLTEALQTQWGLKLIWSQEGNGMFSTVPMRQWGVYDHGFNEHLPLYVRL